MKPLLFAVVFMQVIALSSATCDELGADFEISEALDIQNNRRTILSNSCPNHFSYCQENSCGGASVSMAEIQPSQRYDIPLYPNFAQFARDVTCFDGVIAVALNGVPIYSQKDANFVPVCKHPGDVYATSSVLYDGSYKSAPTNSLEIKGNLCPMLGETDGVLYCGDSIATYGSTFDKCGGHASSGSTSSVRNLNGDRAFVTSGETNGGMYHYHTLPICLLNQLTEEKVNNLLTNSNYQAQLSSISALQGGGGGAYGDLSRLIHSPQIAWALDGFPVYGPRGPGGVLMYPCGDVLAHPVYCLDACNGYSGSIAMTPFSSNYTDSAVAPEINVSLGFGDTGDGYLYRYYMSAGEISSDNDYDILLDEHCSDAVENSGVCQHHVTPLSTLELENFKQTLTRLSYQIRQLQKLPSSVSTSTAIHNLEQQIYDLEQQVALHSGVCCTKRVPARRFRPYSIGCFRGCPLNALADGSCQYSDDVGVLNTFKPSFTDNLITSVYNSKPAVANFRIPISITLPVDPTTPISSNNASNVTIETVELPLMSKSAFRFATNRSIGVYYTKAIETFVTEKLNGEVTNSYVNYSYQGDASQIQILPTASDLDVYFTSIVATEAMFQQHAASVDCALDPNCIRGQVGDSDIVNGLENRFEYKMLDNVVLAASLSSGIYSIDTSDSSMSHIVSGLSEITIYGYNLGFQPSDVKLVTVRDQPCVGVTWYSSNMVRCTFAHIPQYGLVDRANKKSIKVNPELGGITDKDVYIKTYSGEMRGIYGQPMVIVKSNSMRPVISDISFGDVTTAAFVPYALALSPSLSAKYDRTWNDWFGSVSDRTIHTSPVMGHLYFSLLSANQAENQFLNGNATVDPRFTNGRLMRCDLNGDNVYEILADQAKVYGVAVYQPTLNMPTIFTRSISSALGAAGSKSYNQSTSIATNDAPMEIVFFTEATSGSLRFVVTAVDDATLRTNIVTMFNHSNVPDVTTVLSGLIEPRGVTIDHMSRVLYVNLLQGYVIQVNLDWALRGTPYSGMLQSQEQLILDSAKLYNVPAQYNRYVTVFPPSSKSSTRMNSIAVAPLIDNDRYSIPWKQERLFSVDINQQLVSLSAIDTFVDNKPKFRNYLSSPTVINCFSNGYGFKNSIVWPSAAVPVIDTTASQLYNATEGLATPFNNGGVGGHQATVYTLYVSEYLGRIWKLTLQQNYRPYADQNRYLLNTGSWGDRIRYQIVEEPELLLDLSRFEASLTLRRLLRSDVGSNALAWDSYTSRLSGVDNLFASVYFDVLD